MTLLPRLAAASAVAALLFAHATPADEPAVKYEHQNPQNEPKVLISSEESSQRFPSRCDRGAMIAGRLPPFKRGDRQGGRRGPTAEASPFPGAGPGASWRPASGVSGPLVRLTV